MFEHNQSRRECEIIATNVTQNRIGISDRLMAFGRLGES